MSKNKDRGVITSIFFIVYFIELTKERITEMVKIRRGTFETNSSSTHSIVICSKSQFDDWKAGKCFFNTDDEIFVYPDTSKIEAYRKDAIDHYKNYRDVDPYSIKWDELPAEKQEEYIKTHVKYKVEQDNCSYNHMTYDNYRFRYQEGCEYTEKYFTTEHGDHVVAFGKGGYD